MGNMHLVTGFAGREHVTAADHGSFYAALFGGGTYLLDKGGKFALTKISDNLIRIADGDLLMQGRHIRIEDGAYVELAVENGTQGYLRNDLVVARYTKDEDSGVEECNVIILRGDPVGAAPADPAYITGDIINDGATTNDVPLYRLNLDGIEIASVDSLLPDTIPVLSTIPQRIEDLAAELEGKFDGIGNLKIQKGSTYTGTNKNGNVTGSSVTVVLERTDCDYIVFTPDSWADGNERVILPAKQLTLEWQSIGLYDSGTRRQVYTSALYYLEGNVLHKKGALEEMANAAKVYRIYYIDIM